MKWEEFKQQRLAMITNFHRLTPTDVECPECGEFLYRDDSVVLATYPAQHRYECKKCGWEGCSF